MTYQRIVVKIGTSTLTGGSNAISPPRLVQLVQQIERLWAEGRELFLVSSGAIAAGRERLDYPQFPKNTVAAKQMLAAVGQPRLMALYESIFSLYRLPVAQVLLTRADLADRRRYLNARSTLAALQAHRVVPIINENDTVATEEIRFGDNDNLSALVANLVEADLLILLTDQAGMYTADPRTHPEAQIVRGVMGPDIPQSLWLAAEANSSSGLGTGGMLTKLQAADLARRAGAAVVIAAGSEPDVIVRLAAGEALGTFFSPVVSSLEGRKRFLLAGQGAAGKLWVDEGALQALRAGGSLLPVGVTALEGAFERGDTVQVLDRDGREVARGLVNYGAVDLKKIRGRRSAEIETILGYVYGDEVIHRNGMVML